MKTNQAISKTIDLQKFIKQENVKYLKHNLKAGFYKWACLQKN